MTGNPFENALTQLARAGEVHPLNPEVLARLERPEREIHVRIPVRMDDGTLRFFDGYRVQHSSVLGPHKGGIRFHPDTDLNEVRALAFWMTLKTAVTGLPMGGGKGGVTVDPHLLSKGELERLARGFVRRLAPVIGPRIDVPAPDVNTTPEVMAWMVDEYAKLTGDTTNAAFTGKPIDKGGSEGRGKATGLGGFYVFEALKERLGLWGVLTVAVQGIGNVGGHAAEAFVNAGHRIMALSDSRGAVLNEEGLDVAAVEAYKKEHRTLEGYPHARYITNDELLLLPVDILIPAALENQLTSENAKDVRAKLVLELANGPTTPEADDVLAAQGTTVVPDILANAGGVIVSTFEWEQNLKGEHWSEEEVLASLRDTLNLAAQGVWDTAARLSTDLRRAAFVRALERIGDALT